MLSTTSIVIPNYNGREYIAACLNSLRHQTRKPERIIVIDNGSADQSADIVAQDYPEVTLIRLAENTGFCGAVNRGIRESKGLDYVILLNNDTTVEPEFTEELVRAMDRRKQAFSCQAKMLKMSDPSRMDDAGDLYCALGWAFARGKNRPEEQFEKVAEIFSSCAGAAIYRMSILGEIGCFDENHFAYLEDADIGWRARLYGYHNYFIPTARVHHVGSAASGSVYNLFKVINTSRNSIYLISKNMPLGQILLNLIFLIPGFLVKAIFFTKKGFGREYVNGILQGMKMSRKGRREGRHINFTWKRFPIYLRVQLELWVNIVRRLANI